MKKLALFLICIAVMLSGCNSPEPVTEAAIKPLSELTLPEEFRLADDLAQLGGTLFALKDGAIYSCDLETGENVKLTDGEYKYCSVNGDRAYFYNPATGEVASYGEENAPAETVSCPSLICEAMGFAATDNYFAAHIPEQIIVCSKNGEAYKTNKVNQLVCEIKEFKEDTILLTSMTLMGTRTKISEHYLDKGGIRELYSVENTPDLLEATYCEYLDSLLSVFSSYSDISLNGISATGDKTQPTVRMMPCHKDDRITVSENVLCIIGKENVIVRDLANPPQTINVVCFGKPAVLPAGEQYERETGVHINFISYGGDDAAIVAMKLLANDADADIFCMMDFSVSDIFRQDAYTDLYDYPQLKERFESNTFASYVATQDGKCFGVPVGTTYTSKDGSTSLIGETDEFYIQTVIEPYANSAQLSVKYIFENVIAPRGEYLDPDGDKLYEVFRWLYDHPEDPVENPIYPGNMSLISANHMVLNRASKQKDLAVDFLCYVFDVQSGKISVDGYNTAYCYPDVENIEEAYLNRNRIRGIIRLPIDRLMATDGSDEAIRKLAKEVAREYSMILNG